MILASGCSFTDDKYNSKLVTWPHLIAKEKKTKATNLGLRRVGNEFIADRLIEELNKDIVVYDEVYILWSGLGRYHYKIKDDSYTHYNLSNYNYLIMPNHTIQIGPYHFIDKFMHTVYKTQCICEKMRVKLTQMQALIYPYGPENDKYKTTDLYKEIIKHPLYNHITNFIGWPMFKDIGGKYWIDRNNYEDQEYFDSSGHPTQKGHQKIADTFLNKGE